MGKAEKTCKHAEARRVKLPKSAKPKQAKENITTDVIDGTQPMQDFNGMLAISQNDNDLGDMRILELYKLAGTICNDVLTQVLAEIKAGATIAHLCDFSDDLLMKQLHNRYPNKDKLINSIVLPTTVCVNHIVRNFTGNKEDSSILQTGDVVKIELGVQVNGYIATAGHTTVLSPHPGEPIRGPVADVISAAYFASELAWRLIKPGNTSDMVLNGMRNVAKTFNCAPVQATYSNMIRRHVLEAGNEMYNAPDVELNQRNVPFTFGTNEVYTIAIYLVSGSHEEAKEVSTPSIYTYDVGVKRALKLNAARELRSFIYNAHLWYPFRMADLDNKGKLGMSELVSSKWLVPLPVKATKEGTYVAMFRFTILLLPNGEILRLLPSQENMPYIFSEHELPEDLMTVIANRDGLQIAAYESEGSPANKTSIMDVDK